MADTPTFAAPYLGAMVNLVDLEMGDQVAAVVVKVLNADKGRVNLTAFLPGVTPFPVRVACEYNPDQKTKGTWSWPEIPRRK